MTRSTFRHSEKVQEYAVAPKNRLQRMTLCPPQKNQVKALKIIARPGVTTTVIHSGVGPGLSLHKQ